MKKQIIYIPLLNEGVPVFRTTKGVEKSDGTYEVLKTDDYDPDDEEWEFEPGSIVKCEMEIRDGEKVLVAKEKIKD